VGAAIVKSNYMAVPTIGIGILGMYAKVLKFVRVLKKLNSICTLPTSTTYYKSITNSLIAAKVIRGVITYH
jgi:hypothetical protein